ncbi:MAG: hypothetical protein ACJARP_001243, partial [Vicingaceae bacterium]
MKKLNLLFSPAEGICSSGDSQAKLNSKNRFGINTGFDNSRLRSFKRLTMFVVFSMSLIMAGNAQNTVLITPLTPLPAGAGTNLAVSFTTGVTPPATDGVLTVYYQGDFDGGAGNLENADIFDENSVLIGFTPPATQQCFPNLDSVSFVIPVATLSSWAADQIIDFDFTPTANVNPTLCGNDNVRFKLVYTPLTGPDDAALASVDSPYVFCAGLSNAIVTIRNSGVNQLDSVRVNWELNGTAQPTIYYTNMLDTLGGTLPNIASIALGSATFNAGSNTLKAWTSMPNGVADTSNLNDTMIVNLISAAAPTSIALSNVTLTTVDVNAVGGAGTVEYEVGLLGFAPGTGTAGSSPTANFTISGLSQGTTYDVYVRSNCGAGDVSAYIGPQTFNTSYGIPYVQDFENWTPGILNNPLPEGWSKAGAGPRWEAEDASGANENSGNTGPFYDNTTPNTVGGMYLYLETSTGAGSDTLVSPPIFVDTNLSTIEFGFSYHMFGATMGTLEVYADTNGVRNLLTSFVGQQQANQPDGFIRYSTFLNGYQGKSVQLVFMGLRGGSFTSDMSIDDITIDPVLPLNAGVVEVQSPGGNLCPGPVNVAIGVKNFGSLVLDSVNVLWNVNGVLDSVMYVGS